MEPMASVGSDVVLETPADEAPDPESDGPCDDGSGPDQGSASEDSVEEQACLGHGAWVVSETRETLHKVGSCWRRPGLQYRRLTLLDQEEVTDPKAESLLYSRRCLDCFPQTAKEKQETYRFQSEPTGLRAATWYCQALPFAWLLSDIYWSPDG